MVWISPQIHWQAKLIQDIYYEYKEIAPFGMVGGTSILPKE
jgi:hypothetical protein